MSNEPIDLGKRREHLVLDSTPRVRGEDTCGGALNIAGQGWQCNQLQGHGPVCGNPDAQAIWTTPQSGNRMEITVQAPSAEMARMWADRLDQHREEFEQWSRYGSCWHDAADLQEILDRLDALAHDIRQAADR